MGIPGVLASLHMVCPCPRSTLCINTSLYQPSASASSSPSSFGGCRTGLLFGRNHHGCGGGTLGKLSGIKSTRRFNDAAELRLVACSAQESGTLSKVAPTDEEDDSAVRSQGASTIYGDDSITEEKKVVGSGEDEDHSVGREKARDREAGGGEASTASPRPKRINFDYGFQAKFLRTGRTVPGDVFKLAFENFGREWKELRRTYVFQELNTIEPSKVQGGPLGLVAAYTGRGFVLFLRGVDKFLTQYAGVKEVKLLEQEFNDEQDNMRAELKKLVLSNQKVWDREHSREAVKAPWWILGPYYLLCLMLDVIFDNRPIPRFWFLETVARMPYFSYISMLHLYETLGWWRVGAEVRKVHFAEEWNEMHHLKIMESLGGDLLWGDRFFGQHAAFFYYWILNFMFLVSPSVAYNFSELIEAHAVDTYGEFADANEELLKTLPPPPVAVAYYESEDLYMYDEFQTSHLPEARRPKMNSLHDVFLAICGDESEHVKTMVACQKLNEQVISPHRLEKMRK